VAYFYDIRTNQIAPSKSYLLNGAAIEFKIGPDPDGKALIIKAAQPHIVDIKQKLIPNKPGWQIISVTGKALGTAVLQGYIETNSASPGRSSQLRCTACIPLMTVEVLPKMEWPDQNSEVGALARMLVAENITPHDKYGRYKEEDSLKSMQWMRNVLENRLAFSHPHLLQVPSGVRSLLPLIKSRGVVEGFKSYPDIGVSQKKVIDSTLSIANNVRDPKFMQYRIYMQNAIAVAKGEKRGVDPCSTKLYAWRTAGPNSSPGVNFIKFQTLAGQDFYTLTPGFIENPLHPTQVKKN